MKFNNEFWAVIPARSGSKSIKHKNLVKIDGKPLIAYSIIAANKNKDFKKVIFSSDSNKYYRIAKKFGKCEFHKRSKKISSDKTTELEVLKNVVNIYRKNFKTLPKFIVSLRPTSPIRFSKTVSKGIKLFKKKSKNYTALKSVSLMSETAFKTLRIINNKLSGLCSTDFKIARFDKSRQLYQKTYEANGIIDIYKTENILKGDGLGNKVLPFIVEDINSDIDNIDDIEYIKYYIKKKKFNILKN